MPVGSGTHDASEPPALTTEAVLALVQACAAGPGGEAVEAEGIRATYRFDRTALDARIGSIERLIRELPDEFLSGGGGGWSFLNLCEDRAGRLWTGQHGVMEALVCLCIAAGRARYLLPRSEWGLLYGGFPFVEFWFADAGQAEAA